jgi:hypothetical protein
VKKHEGNEGRSDPLRERAHYFAGKAVVCGTLFGDRVIKCLSTGRTGALETFSDLPIPLACRPPARPRGESRPPVAVAAVADAHGILAYAGAAAVEELRRRGSAAGSASAEPVSVDCEDRERLAKLALQLGLERPADIWFEDYAREASRLLCESWPVVERLAEALAERGSLNGDRVDLLISGEATR